MAILSLKLEFCGKFISIGQVIVDDTLNEISIGSVYNLSGCTIVKGREICFNDCFTVVGFEQSASIPNTVILNSYGIDGCTDCQLDTSNYLVFNECLRNGLLGRIFVPISGFTGTTVIDDVYLLSMYVNYDGDQIQYTGCFQLIGYSINKNDGDYDVFILEQTQKTDCEICLKESPIIYEVLDCLNPFGSPYYISLPSTGFEYHLITFTDLDGLTQYCGNVKGTIVGQPTTGILISDLGIPEETGVTCDDCLLNVAEKRKLVNCLNPLDIEIVWASTLFEPEQSTHLSSGDGCYEISPDVVSGETVTITELANFDPQNDCNTCFECYGLVYDYQTCEPQEVCGPQNIITTNNFGTGLSTRDIKIDSNDNIFITFNQSGRIAKYDLNTLSFVEQSNNVLNGAYGIDIDETNGVICVSNRFSNYVSFFNYTFLSNGYSLPSSFGGNKVYLNPNDGYFYVTFDNCCSSPNVKVYSGSSFCGMTLTTEFGSISNSYRDIIQVGSSIYVASYNTQSIEVYDTSYNLTNTIFLGQFPTSFDYNPLNNTLYISTISPIYIKLDLSTNGIVLNSFSSNCWSTTEFVKIKLNTNTNKLYITNTNCNSIHEFDLTTDTLIRIYDDELTSNGVLGTFAMDNDTSGNTWFGSYDRAFELGCTNQIINGQTIGNEFLSAGTTFFNYQLSACCEITSVSNNTDDSFTFNEYLSMLHYEDCQTCTGTTHELFYCQSCDGSIEAVLVAPSLTFTIGQFVRSHWGNSHFLCFEIMDNYTVADYGTGYPSFEAQGEPPFASCSACTSGTSIGLTIINCDTLVPSQVNVTLENWLQIAGFPTFVQNPVISDSNGVCYQVVNLCPIDNNNPEFPIQEFFVNQLFCRLSNATPGRPAPVSAGTEYFACQICCPCESGGTVTSVAVPHPVWTGLYGNAVTLLDAVQLGGMNGLNN